MHSTTAHIEKLKAILYEIDALYTAASILTWDQETYMPAGGEEARARQLGTLERLAHDRFTGSEIGALIDSLAASENGLPPGSMDAALVTYVDREYRRLRQVPADRMAALVEHGAATYPVWARARERNDFQVVAPHLEKTLDLSRELAGYFSGFDHIADPLIDFEDPGMRVAEIRRIFADLRRELVPLVAEIAQRPQPDDRFLHRGYPIAEQEAFGLDIARMIGFDPQRNRQDLTLHPFMTRFSAGDVRITTRFLEHNFSEGFFSTLHETGHALYEMGIDQGLDGLPIAQGTSAGFHESQSRLWENLVGRGRDFWEFAYPLARERFPDPLGQVPVEEFYRAINIVRPSLIRTDADEVTYNLHVMIRFDLELQLLEGSLAVRDLPEAWRARYLADLGVAPEGDADGVLQDAHWFADWIGGAFQGYTLGNIISAQIYEGVLDEIPDLPGQIRTGEFQALREWLRSRIHRYGRIYSPAELLERVTGGGLDSEPLMRYLRRKYGELYGLG